jgi:DNA-binding MarR family transcriptional regulator
MPRRAADQITLDPGAARVLRQFRIVFNSVRKHVRATERKAGISGAHAWALAAIGEAPSIGISGLARAMDVHQSTASNLVRHLIAEGLVVAERDGEDRRAVRLALTTPGRRALRAAPHPYAGVLPGALRQLEPRTLKRLEKDLNALIEVLAPGREGAHRPLGEKQD